VVMGQRSTLASAEPRPLSCSSVYAQLQPSGTSASRHGSLPTHAPYRTGTAPPPGDLFYPSYSWQKLAPFRLVWPESMSPMQPPSLSELLGTTPMFGIPGSFSERLLAPCLPSISPPFRASQPYHHTAGGRRGMNGGEWTPPPVHPLQPHRCLGRCRQAVELRLWFGM
jgi:hypothetical protein